MKDLRRTSLFLTLFFSIFTLAESSNITPTQALEEFKIRAEKINVEPIVRAATQDRGRVKPFETYARENILYVMGKYDRWGLSSAQIYLGLLAYDKSNLLEILEIRDPQLRTEIGLIGTQRYASLAMLEASPLENLARPLYDKQEKMGGKKLDEHEKKTLEAYHQMRLLRSILEGGHLFVGLDFSVLNNESRHAEGTTPPRNEKTEAIRIKLSQYIGALSANQDADAEKAAGELVELSKGQETPELFQHYLNTLDTEILFNRLQLFFWSGISSLFLGLVFLYKRTREKLNKVSGLILHSLPLIPLVAGVALRVYITRFAPVTNMYGTMLWVAFGVTIFSIILFFLYQSYTVSGMMLLGSSFLLLLTEKIPLTLSPDLDPIVAVLRNNFWLSTHVTTITISYAAFTVAMIMGNVALFRMWTHTDNKAFFKEYSHYAYRMIQLGCFLLTIGIILGGVWADYSWGRFWGWDPKETWALIADLGFLAIMHARQAGWVNDFTLLAWSPIAYLLVIMAWYGVNFILAAGLHSYGFSSGGATMVASFVSVQLILLIAAFIRLKMVESKKVSPQA